MYECFFLSLLVSGEHWKGVKMKQRKKNWIPHTRVDFYWNVFCLKLCVLVFFVSFFFHFEQLFQIFCNNGIVGALFPLFGTTLMCSTTPSQLSRKTHRFNICDSGCWWWYSVGQKKIKLKTFRMFIYRAFWIPNHLSLSLLQSSSLYLPLYPNSKWFM